MILNQISRFEKNKTPLTAADLPVPAPHGKEILIKVSACGVCHTELDEIEGRTPPTTFPVVPGHQVVGTVFNMGESATRFNLGTRVGVGWIYSACGKCIQCTGGNENLCKEFVATGRDANGGYAEFMAVPEDFAFKIPEVFSDSQAAPLLCAGAIGYRSLHLAQPKDGQNIGLTGFGASAHLVLKMIRHQFPSSRIYVFARSQQERRFAGELGAFWTGTSDETPPHKLNSIIDTTPAWKPVVDALKNLESGGRLVINAIRKEESDKDYLLTLDYPPHLWLEKEIKSVANVTRKDISAFLALAADIPIIPEVQEFQLDAANRALFELKDRKIKGAKVLCIE